MLSAVESALMLQWELGTQPNPGTENQNDPENASYAGVELRQSLQNNIYVYTHIFI